MPLSTSAMINKDEILDLLDEAARAPPRGAAGRPLAAQGARGVPGRRSSARATTSSSRPAARPSGWSSAPRWSRPPSSGAARSSRRPRPRPAACATRSRTSVDQKLGSFEIVLENDPGSGGRRPGEAPGRGHAARPRTTSPTSAAVRRPRRRAHRVLRPGALAARRQPPAGGRDPLLRIGVADLLRHARARGGEYRRAGPLRRPRRGRPPGSTPTPTWTSRSSSRPSSGGISVTGAGRGRRGRGSAGAASTSSAAARPSSTCSEVFERPRRATRTPTRSADDEVDLEPMVRDVVAARPAAGAAVPARTAPGPAPTRFPATVEGDDRRRRPRRAARPPTPAGRRSTQLRFDAPTAEPAERTRRSCAEPSLHRPAVPPASHRTRAPH